MQSLKIGETVARRRRELGWTQERLAQAVGVTGAAVSKWETGATFPDIALLPPLARALGISTDELLSFSREPAAAELWELEGTLEKAFASGGFEAGMAAAAGLEREYPCSSAVRMRICAVLQKLCLLIPGWNETDERARQARELSERLCLRVRDDGGEPASAAAVLLYAAAAEAGDYTRAQELLDALPRPAVDVRQLYPGLYLRQGRLGEAERAAQNALYQSLHEALNMTRMLGAIARGRGEAQRALDLDARCAALADLFSLPELSGPDARAAALAACGRMDEALDCFERFAAALPGTTLELSGHPLFSQVKLSAGGERQIERIKRALPDVYETDPAYEALRGEPRFRAAVRRLREELGRSADPSPL